MQVNQLAASTTNYPTKPLLDGNPPVIARRASDAAIPMNHISPTNLIIADASNTKPIVPTIELSKYTWASSEEAFNEYTLAAARLQVEYHILLDGASAFDDKVVNIMVFKQIVKDLPDWERKSAEYSQQEANNPFYDQAREYVKKNKNGTDIMPAYFQEKVKNFAVSYGMYVASYGAQKGVSDADNQLATWHDIVKKVASPVFQDDTAFWADISRGGDTNDKHLALLDNFYYPNLKKIISNLNDRIKNGAISNNEMADTVNDINSTIKITASSFFLNKIPHSPSRVKNTIDVTTYNLGLTGNKFIIK